MRAIAALSDRCTSQMRLSCAAIYKQFKCSGLINNMLCCKVSCNWLRVNFNTSKQSSIITSSVYPTHALLRQYFQKPDDINK